MEFHEKLQQLRKQNNMTQEQLAQSIFVSRTAVSKWESGRGYPNLESLKCLSRVLHISIDELLSNNELVELAATENRANIKKVSAFVFSALDIISLAFMFMPMFGVLEGEYVRAVGIFNDPAIGGVMRLPYIAALVLIPAFGVFEIAVQLLGLEKLSSFGKGGSMLLCSAAILLFAISRQPYVTVFLFLLFMVKAALIMYENRVK